MDLTHVTSNLPPHILIGRHPHHQRHFFDVLLDWTAQHFPALRPLFHIVEYPHRVAGLHNCRLFTPWLQDPVQDWAPDVARWADDLAGQCRHLGIPVINPTSHHLNAAKSTGARLLAQAGIRTPKIALIRDAHAFRETFCGIPFPLFIREDWGHHSLIYSARTPDQARAIPLHAFKRPVAIELIDVRRPDGLFYKHRYLAAGTLGISHHLQASTGWVTRGTNRVVNDQTRAAELAYIATRDPHHALFQQAIRPFGLQLLTLDYGHTPAGELVVWEVNPFPFIQFAKAETRYRNLALHRSVAAILHLYLAAAGFPVPPALAELTRYASPPPPQYA